MSAPAPTAKPKTASLTAYRVLKFPAAVHQPNDHTSMSGDLDGYKDMGGTEATNAHAAVKIIAEKAGAGTYVAVPATSWKPVSVTVESVTVIKLGDPTA